MNAVDFRGVSKVYTTRSRRKANGHLAVSGVDLTVKAGEFVCFVGPSGCGKTTVLNMIAGAIDATEGSISVSGKAVKGLQVGMGYVTQEDSLLPWRTLLRNVTFGLDLAGVPKPEADAKARQFIEKVGLGGFEDHYPYQLSGGMRKRAGLIRTLVTGPDIILMDEPFGAVDAQTRLYLQDELLRLWQDLSSTIVFVTHDLVEAITLADRVVCFDRNPGRVKEIVDVHLERPRDVFRIHETPGYSAIYDRVWSQVHDSDAGGVAAKPPHSHDRRDG